jgi:hypothetical protein
VELLQAGQRAFSRKEKWPMLIVSFLAGLLERLKNLPKRIMVRLSFTVRVSK